MEQFVCVRLVQANAMDLSLFQFDYDLTFAIILMNADKTIYGRFGTRSSQHDAEKDISLEGLAQALAGALELHQEYPANKVALGGKQSVPTKYKSPDDFPLLHGKYGATLDYENQVVGSCMHCHQIRDAERQVYRSAGEPIPDDLLFPYPSPELIGLTLDPQARATVTGVLSESSAGKAGFQQGDQIITLDGQPILSTADVQWVLHNAADDDELVARVNRNRRELELTVRLNQGWRRTSDISWRVTSWPLRRMGTGGLVLKPLTAADRRAANLDQSALALSVNHVGQYGPHAVAKQAGFLKGDIVVAFDGLTRDMSESELLAHTARHTQPEQQVPVTVLRGSKRINLVLRMQK